MMPLFDKASRPVMLEAKAFLLDFRPRLRLGLEKASSCWLNYYKR